jgi:hypothetical protein
VNGTRTRRPALRGRTSGQGTVGAQAGLRFGRFLSFGPAGPIPKNLTEWRFRGYWSRTDPTDNEGRPAFKEDLGTGESVDVGDSGVAIGRARREGLAPGRPPCQAREKADWSST